MKTAQERLEWHFKNLNQCPHHPRHCCPFQLEFGRNIKCSQCRKFWIKTGRMITEADL